MAQRRRWRWWLTGGAVAVVVLGVGGPFVYIHLIEGPAKPELTLPGDAWGIENPSVGGFVTTAGQGTLEVLLRLSRGRPSSPARSPGTSAEGPPGGGPGGPGQVTLSATTLPPLSIPSP